MQGQRMKKLFLLPLVLAALELDQSASSFLPEPQSSSALLSSQTNQLPPSGDVTTSLDDLGIPSGDQGDYNDPDEPRRRHLYPGAEESFAEFLSGPSGDDGDEESVAERTTRGYFNVPVNSNDDNLRPAGRSSSSDHYPQHHGPADIEDSGVQSGVTSFGQPRDASQPRSHGLKLPRDGDDGAIYNDDQSATYNTDRSATFNSDSGAAYNRDSDAGQSRDDSGTGGFMGDEMHMSLMAKLHGASAHAFDGADQYSRLEFGPPAGGSASTGAEATPSYKPVYEAPSRQPDPRPHPGQRPAPLQHDDGGDYRLNGADDSHQGDGTYWDDKAYENQQPYDNQESYAGQETYPGHDHVHQGDDEGRVNGGDDYRKEDYRGDDYRGEDYRGEDYKGDGYRGDGYRGEDSRGDDPRGGHGADGHREEDYQGGDYRGGNYGSGDNGAEEDRRGGYAAFDPYKEAAQAEEVFRAVEGETDRYGRYSRGRGGTRHPDREDGTPYPSRYEESAMDRGYEADGGYHGSQGRDHHRQQEQGTNDERSGYHGDRNSKRSARHGNGGYERSGRHSDGGHDHSGYYGNLGNGYQNNLEVHNNGNAEHSPVRQKRDLKNAHKVFIFTKEVRKIHPVIHRHYEGIPPPTKVVASQTQVIPTPVIGISTGTVEIPQENAEVIPAMTIYREDIPPSAFYARLAHLPSRRGGVPGIVRDTQQPLHVGSLSPTHAHSAPTQPGQGRSVPDGAKTEVYPGEGAQKPLIFSPGVIHTGFVPMVDAHHISKRSLKSGAGDPVTPGDSVTSDDPVTSGDLVISGDSVTSGTSVTSGDLLPAGSRRRAVYQPHYAEYDRQQGRQNAASEQDPYERYLPREDQNDPYFRYAPRDSIQHSHDFEQKGRTDENSHEKYDHFGQPRKNSQSRRPQVEDDYIDYDDEDYHGDNRQDGGYPSYDDYEETYANTPTRKRLPDYDYNDQSDSSHHSNGRRGNRRGGGQRFQDVGTTDDYEDDLFGDYEDDQQQRAEEKRPTEDNQRSGSPLSPVTTGGVSTFSPGVIRNGFVPITQTPHQVSKRSLASLTTKQGTSHSLEETTKTPDPEKQQETSKPAEYSSHKDRATNSSDSEISNDTGLGTTGNLVTSGTSVTSGDLLPAGSRRRAVYQPHYAEYDRQQGRQNAASEQDPYERYLPREDQNDPYFRYAPREYVQHSHDTQQAGRTAEKEHAQFDLYGTPRKSSDKRRPQPQADYPAYDDEDYHDGKRQDSDYPSYDDYEEDYVSPPTRNPTRKRYPDYDYDDVQSDSGYDSSGRRGNRRGSGKRYQDENNHDYESDVAEDYEDDLANDYDDKPKYNSRRQGEHADSYRQRGQQRRRYANRPGSAYYSGRYRDEAEQKQDGDAGGDARHQHRDQRRRYRNGRPRDRKYTDEEDQDISRRAFKDTRDASGAYEDTRGASGAYEDTRGASGAYEDTRGASGAYEDTRDASGAYEDNYHEAAGAYKQSPGDRAAGGFDDTRRAVSGMLAGMAQKKRDGSCKEVKRDGMSCLQCSDINGMKTEECAYAGEAPGSGRSGYSTSSSYGDPPSRQDSSRAV